MDHIAHFQRRLISEQLPLRVTQACLNCVRSFSRWADHALPAAGGLAGLVSADIAALEAYRERYLAQTISDRDLRNDERRYLNRFIRFVVDHAAEQLAPAA